MHKRSWMFVVAVASVVAGVAYAQYPIMDAVADKVIQKYQTSICQQLWQEKAQKQGQPKPEMEQRAINALQAAIPRCARRSSPKSRHPSSTRCSNAE